MAFETTGAETIHYTYDGNGAPFSMTYNGSEYFYLTNLQGDVTGLADAYGAAVVSYSYDSWGKLISTTGSMASTLGVKNPYRYRGYRFDTETGLYYLQSRYYNSEIGRFLNADNSELLKLGVGKLLSANLFNYANNNPVNDSDSSGYFPLRSLVDLLVSGLSLFKRFSPLRWIFASYWAYRFFEQLNHYQYMKGQWIKQRYRNPTIWNREWKKFSILQTSNMIASVLSFIAASTTVPEGVIAGLARETIWLVTSAYSLAFGGALSLADVLPMVRFT